MTFFIHQVSQPSQAMCLFVLYIQQTDRQDISPTRAPTYLSWHRDKQDFLFPPMLFVVYAWTGQCGLFHHHLFFLVYDMMISLPLRRVDPGYMYCM